MRDYFVRCAPMGLIVGGYSVGTHVFTNSPERAAEVAIHLGYSAVIEVIECPSIFTCTCTADARKVAVS